MDKGASRSLLAIALTAASLVGSGCAVRSWKRDGPSAVALRKGDLVRGTGPHGTVELIVVTPGHPFVFGHPRPGTGLVYASLDGVRRMDVGDDRKGAVRSRSAAATARRSELIGQRVQLTTIDGPVAIRVVDVDEHLVSGQPCSCREAGRDVPCTGVVWIDVRELERIDHWRTNVVATAGVNLGILAAGALSSWLLLFMLFGG